MLVKRNNASYSNNIKIILGLPKSFWLLIIITVAINLTLLGLYFEYCKLPDIIRLSDKAYFNAVDYDAFIDKIDELNTSYMHHYIITPKKGLEQILLHTLREDKPEAYVRDMFMEKQLKLQLISIVWFLLNIILIHKLIRFLMKKKYMNYRFVVNTLLTFLTFYYLRFFVVIPAELIPSKLIDLRGWKINISSYVEYLRRLKELTEKGFWQEDIKIIVVYLLLILGIIIFLFMNHRVNSEIKMTKNIKK